VTRIDVIRHGEPVGGRRYRGHGVDDPLSETGWQQMWASIPETPSWDLIISSPLLRCVEFARALAERSQIPCSIVDDMKEIGFGEWEGKTPDEIIALDPNALDRFINDPIHNRPEGAESLEDFSTRVWSAYQVIVKEHQGKHILIVAHAGVARAITANVLGMRLDDAYSRLKVEYGAVVSTLIEKPGSPPKLLMTQTL
jgi:broad specificity phosphatase PhoE